MKFIKTLIVWLLLLAIPLQGHAVVAANFCAMSEVSASAVPTPPAPSHVAMASGHEAAMAAHANCDKAVSAHKCSNCASSGMSVFFVPATWPPAAFAPTGSERIAYVAAFATTRLPDGLERPPHSPAA
jgi:hypothetical protein